jgi:hypothetical protein
MTKKLILKYLNPSPVTAKGHMKHPRHGIQSPRTKTPAAPIVVPVPVIPPVLPLLGVNIVHGDYIPTIPGPALINDDTNESIANIFLFWCICRLTIRSSLQRLDG